MFAPPWWIFSYRTFQLKENPNSWRTGGGNSNIFHFHPDFFGEMIQFDERAYFLELVESIWKKG